MSRKKTKISDNRRYDFRTCLEYINIRNFTMQVFKSPSAEISPA